MTKKVFCTSIVPNQTCYRRYHNTKRRLKDLQHRFANLRATISNGCGTDLPETIGDVQFIILSKTRSRSTTTYPILNALVPNGDKEEKRNPGGTLQEVLAKVQTETTIVFLPSRLSELLHNNISKILDIQFVIVTDDTQERQQNIDLFKAYSNVKVSLMEDVNDTATVVLEEIIFRPMKYTIETLVNLRKLIGRHYNKEDQKGKRSEPKSYISTASGSMGKVTRKRKSARKGKKTTQLKIGLKEHSICNTKNQDTRKRKKGKFVDSDFFQRYKHVVLKGYPTRSFKEKIQKQKNTIDQLLEEIYGMYDRSKVPENKKPVIKESFEQNVSDELAAELYAIDVSVKSCGYRFETLQVFVDETCNEEIKEKVKGVLQKNKIMYYDIAPSIGSFKPLYKVGAKIQTQAGYGTVGGFAKTGKKGLCALVSRHVATKSSDRNVLLQNGQMKIQARIIPETIPPEESQDMILDISAAAIKPIDTEKCDTRFKTEAGEPTTGTQCSYEPGQLRGRQVHLWGGTTSPGSGIITIPEIRDRDEDNTFIIVENRQNTNETFCKNGDSGSMVCADDIDGEGVEVVSMLIGVDNYNPGKYATFRIDKGIEQLKRQTNDDFHLCLD